VKGCHGVPTRRCTVSHVIIRRKCSPPRTGLNLQNPVSKNYLRMTEFQFQSAAPQVALSYKHIKTDDVKTSSDCRTDFGMWLNDARQHPSRVENSLRPTTGNKCVNKTHWPRVHLLKNDLQHGL
jgi:hypothetical protein